MLDLKELLRQEFMAEVAEIPHFGVYELVWDLRGYSSRGYGEMLTDPERVTLAKQVAREALESGRVKLYKFRWPGFEPISGPISLNEITEEDWLNIPESGEYPAFVWVKE